MSRLLFSRLSASLERRSAGPNRIKRGGYDAETGISTKGVKAREIFECADEALSKLQTELALNNDQQINNDKQLQELSIPECIKQTFEAGSEDLKIHVCQYGRLEG